MGLRAWWHRLQKHEDDKALERAAERQLENPEEREISNGDMEGMLADEMAGRSLHDSSAEGLAERDDE
jgi:hypothetical protein